MKRQVILTYEPEGITAEVPSLEGCTTYGFTKEEALERAKEAIQLAIETDYPDSNCIPADPKIEVVELDV